MELKQYNVTLSSIDNRIKNIDYDNPILVYAYFDIDAYSKEQAIEIAKERYNRSVWGNPL